MNRLIFSVLCIVSTLGAATAPKISQMSAKDSTYSLILTFTTSLPKEKLMEVLFTYEHTKKYVKQPNLSISLIRETERENLIKYHYNYFVSKMDMEIENRISPDYNHFVFEQTSFSRTNKLIPEVITSGGKYDIVKIENGTALVRYSQWGKMDQKISGIFAKIIEMESVGFIKSLVKYVGTLEPKTDVALAPSRKKRN